MTATTQSPVNRQSAARDLQRPGDELARHDLSLFFLRHPAHLEIFHAEEEACLDDDEREALVRQWHRDLMTGGLS